MPQLQLHQALPPSEGPSTGCYAPDSQSNTSSANHKDAATTSGTSSRAAAANDAGAFAHQESAETKGEAKTQKNPFKSFADECTAATSGAESHKALIESGSINKKPVKNHYHIDYGNTLRDKQSAF